MDDHPPPPPVPGVAGDAGEGGDGTAGDEPRLTVEPLDGRGSRRAPAIELRPLLNALSVALAVAVLAAAVVTLARGPGRAPSAAPQAAGASAAGWVHAGPALAQSIAFAPDAPALAYSCGPSALSDLPVPLRVGVSRDDGATWRTRDSAVAGLACALTVDPADARDLVLAATLCASCALYTPRRLYRSFDGGASWRPWPLPPSGSPAADDAALANYQWAWVGRTLFVAAGGPNRRLAASRDGGPFAWITLPGGEAGVPAGAVIGQLFAAATALYLGLSPRAECPPACVGLLRSDDDGATWTPFAPTYAGRPVAPLGASVGGAVLFGRSVADAGGPAPGAPLLRSTDGGATWRALPAAPARTAALRLVATPDGAVYAELYDTGDPSSAASRAGLYRLPPPASGWSYVAPLPEDVGGPLVVAWDGASGAPVGLWAGAHLQFGFGQVRLGIEYHRP
jgi:hypothetical protein